MSIIAWIVLGAIAGYIAGFLVTGDEGLGIIGHIVLGIVGALVGGFLASALFNSHPIDGPFDISSIVVSVIGAIIVVLVVGAVTGPDARRSWVDLRPVARTFDRPSRSAPAGPGGRAPSRRCNGSTRPERSDRERRCATLGRCRSSCHWGFRGPARTPLDVPVLRGCYAAATCLTGAFMSGGGAGRYRRDVAA